MAIQKRTTKAGKTRWVARYRDAAGKEHSRSFDTQREAKAHVQEQERALRRGEWVDPRDTTVTLGVLLDQWVARAQKPNTRASRRRSADNAHPLLNVPVVKVRRSMVQELATTLTTGRPWAGGAPLSGSTASMVIAAVRGVLQTAVIDGLISKNPAEGVRVPTRRGGALSRADIPSVAEVQRNVEVLRADHPGVALGVELAAFCGLRVGEVAGLQVGDVDFLRRELHIERQYSSALGGYAGLKTSGSRRVVPVAEWLIFALSEWCGGADRGDSVLAPGGRVLSAEWLARQHREVLTAAGIMAPRFHAYRHFFASSLLADGVPVPVVARLMGHGNITMVMQTYAHFLPDQQDSLRVAIDGFAGSVRDQDERGAGFGAG
ncbi:tyrosine-type recombinase/integrase [Corynebacterium pseudopelargi]|uniref:Tyrosine recombinase XerC n=1 Tax=Corynebacterium pseudopelargi TaxID=2080757 RepID=A0A3G6IT69_9CORY|nr:site-specific integrase [Corynebacterium pseudopelargi]AZA08747.1 Tyrosine recombinase XerC [Corynebacterium pseudopelargi]